MTPFLALHPLYCINFALHPFFCQLYQPVLIVRRPALCVIDTATGHVEFSPDPSQHATFLQSVLRYEQYYASIFVAVCNR